MSAENPSEAVSETEPAALDEGIVPAAHDAGEPSVTPDGTSESRRVSEAVPASSTENADPSSVEGYRVSLPMFEGPLDLLLHLVQKHELDILDIPIAFITEKYTAYIRLLDELNIDLASEYLVMAATLVHIKSRMLLPNAPVDEEDESEESELDPRADLVRRLLEYQKYKNAADSLAQRSILGKDVFPRGSSLETVSGQMPLMAVSMFQLIDVFQSVLERTAQTRQHEIDFERFSISEKITELLERLRSERRIEFERIFSGDRNRGEIIVTFLALLEMTRLRLTWLFQDGPLAPIFIELRASDEEAAEADVAASDAAFEPPAARRPLEASSAEPAALEPEEGEPDELALDDLELEAEELDDVEPEETERAEAALDEVTPDEPTRDDVPQDDVPQDDVPQDDVPQDEALGEATSDQVASQEPAPDGDEMASLDGSDDEGLVELAESESEPDEVAELVALDGSELDAGLPEPTVSESEPEEATEVAPAATEPVEAAAAPPATEPVEPAAALDATEPDEAEQATPEAPLNDTGVEQP